MGSMNEYDYSRAKSTASVAVATQTNSVAPPTQAQRTRDAVISAERELSAGEYDAGTLRRAAAQNDRGQWETAHTKLSDSIAEARIRIDLSRMTAGHDHTPEVDARLEAMEDRLAHLQKANDEATKPLGYKRLSNEEQILAAVVAKVPRGDAKVGYPRKEAEIGALLDQLDPAESRALLARIQKPVPEDALAAAFANPNNLPPRRREHLLEYLGGAREREARRARSKQAGAGAAPVGETSTSTANDQPAPAETHRDDSPHGADTSAPSTAPTSPHGPSADTTRTDAREPDHPSHDRGIPGFTRRKGAAVGAVIVSVVIDIATVPIAQRRKLPPAVTTVQATLRSDGDSISIDVAVDDDHWVMVVAPEAFVHAVVGSDTAAAKLVDLGDLMRTLKTRSQLTGSRLRINLPGQGTDQNFVVLDLARLVGDLGSGSLEGLRPVEAQLLVGNTGVRKFENHDVKETAGMPGEPLGGWFDVPDGDGQLRKIAGHDRETHAGPANTVAGGVFYAGGVLRVAIKPTASAHEGITAQIDLVQILGALKKYRAKAAAWVTKLTTRIASGTMDFLRVVGGKLHLELPDAPHISFDFDFKLSLPTLWRGHGFDWSSLLPSGFHIDMGSWSVGALPHLRFPWLSLPSLGSWRIPLDKLERLLPGLPAIHLPDLAFDLHWTGSGLRFGLGARLAALFPDMPELADLAFGFELDLSALLEKAGDAGRAIANSAQAGAAFVKQWVHFGNDGVLRIFEDGRSDGPMLGFHLMRLFDGAQATDLIPTEMRYTGEGPEGHARSTATLELGEKGIAATTDPTKPGKVRVQRPGGTLLGEQKLQAPASAATALALEPGTNLDVAVFGDGNRLEVFAEGASTVYRNGEAMLATVDLAKPIAAVRKAVAKRLPNGHVDLELSKDMTTGIRFDFTADKTKGHVEWSFAQLVEHDWSSLAPTILLEHEGVGGIQNRGKIPARPSLVSHRVEVHSAALRHKLLGIDDKTDEVFAGLHYEKDIIGISVIGDENKEEGALAYVHPSFLLQAVKKLGKVGESMLHKLAELAGGAADKLEDLAERLMAFVDRGLLEVGQLEFKFGDGHLNFRILDYLPHLPDLDLSKLGNLIPDFDFPDLHLGGLHFGFKLDLLEKFGAATGWAQSLKMPAFLRDLSLPKLDFDLNFRLSGSDLSIWLGFPHVDFDFLKGRAIGFNFPIEKLLAKAKQLASWFGQKAGKLEDMVHLGHDGVLRIYDRAEPHGNRVGYDLMKLFDGYSPDDLVPVELHAEIDVKKHDVAEVSYGDDQISKADKEDKAKETKGDRANNPGKVLVPPPKGSVVGRTQLAAPEWIRDHLDVPPKARIHASLYLDKTDAVLFASVDGSDRGAEIRVHTGELAKAVGAIGPVKVDAGITIDAKASIAKGMLVMSFGKEKGEGLHGHAAWRIDNLLADPSFSSLVPDELDVENKQGKLEMSNAIDVSGLQPVAADIKLEGLDWARRVLGDAHAVTLFASRDLKRNPRIALATERRQDGTRAGVELTVDKGLVATIEHRAQELADRTVAAANKAFKHDRDASSGQFKIHATAGGITVDRGVPNTAQYMYATFGWQHLGALIGGDSTSLIPDDLRVGTNSMALEAHALPATATRSASAHAIDTLHPLLKEPLLAVGFEPTQLIDFDLKTSKLTDAETKQVRAIAHIWDVEGDGEQVTGGREIAVTLDLEALLAHLLPHRRTWTKKNEVKKGAGTSISASVGVTDDLDKDGVNDRAGAEHLKVAGVEMSAALHHTSKSGTQTDLELDVGWSLDQILDVLLHMHEGTDAQGAADGSMMPSAGSLIPERIHGSFATDKFKVDFGNDGKKSDYNCAVDAVPGLSSLLGAVLDPQTLAAATLNLNIPSKEEFAHKIKQSLASGALFIPIGGCSLGVPTKEPGTEKYYEITFSVTPAAFKRLVLMIPGLGELYKFVSTLLDIASDPIGTAEAVINTPEALLDIVEAAPEVYGNLKKMGFKRIAMGLVMGSHPTIRQFVLASRVKKMMEAKGWKPGDPTPTEWGDIPDPYLSWLAQQDPQALVEGAELDALAKRSGIEIEKNYAIPPGGTLIAADIKAQIDTLEHGFKDLDEARDHEKSAPPGSILAQIATKQTAERAEKLRTHLHEVLDSGVKSSPPSGEEPQAHTDRKADVDDAAINKIDHAPTKQQMDEARGLFGADAKEGKVIAGPEAEAWIQTFAGLSQDELGELLVAGRVIVTSGPNKRQIAVAGDAQRGFVRALMVKRMNAAGHKVPTRTDDKETDDARLVAAQRTQEQRDQATKAADEEGSKSAQKGDDDLDQETETENVEDAGKGTGKIADAVGGTAKETKDGGAVIEKTSPAKVAPSAKASSAHDDTPASLDAFTHFDPATAQKYVKIDASQDKVELDRDKAAQDLIGKTFRNGSDTIRIIDMSAGAIARSGSALEYVISWNVQAGSQPLESLVSHRYVYNPKTGTSGEFGAFGDPNEFARKVNAAIKVHGNTAMLTEARTFTVGKYTLTILALGSGRVEDSPGEHGLVNTTVRATVRFDKIEGDGSGVAHDADGKTVVVHPRDQLVMRLPVLLEPKR